MKHTLALLALLAVELARERNSHARVRQRSSPTTALV